MSAMDDQGFLLLEDLIFFFLCLKCIYMEIGIHLNVFSLNSPISYLSVLRKKKNMFFQSIFITESQFTETNELSSSVIEFFPVISFKTVERS